ncbi:MAG: 2-phospho-L-lactate guanylyltransferase [Thaumarchaeota archaeon]|nr:2-phospho-L-lactate guanylyltransferase [Nitrososphaerota archaeon]
MTSLAVIVPVKSSGSKSRLSPALSAEQRRAFAASLLKGVIQTVARAGLVGSCMVVSSDDGALKTAAGLGARPVRESGDAGVNAAVRVGMDAARDIDEFLVLPSDLPLLSVADIRAVLRLRRRGLEVVVSPSRSFDGTNALLFPRTPAFPLSFDADSFWNHLAGAARLRLPVGVCARGGITFDVDSPADLRSLAETGARTESAAIARGAPP